MDNETINMIVDLKIKSKELDTLINAILENTRLSYDGKSMIIDDERTVMTLVKLFDKFSYTKRFEELKEKEVCENGNE